MYVMAEGVPAYVRRAWAQEAAAAALAWRGQAMLYELVAWAEAYVSPALYALKGPALILAMDPRPSRLPLPLFVVGWAIDGCPRW
jgi:hypothetical protein